MVDPAGGRVPAFSGANRYDEAEIPASVRMTYTYVGSARSSAYRPGAPKQPVDAEEVKSDVEIARVLSRYIGRMLARGDSEGHPVEVIPGGLNGSPVRSAVDEERRSKRIQVHLQDRRDREIGTTLIP